MSRRRHTPEQIIRKLAEGQKLLAGGMDLEGVCRQLEIAESTWARWMSQYGGMKADDAKRLKEDRVDLEGLVSNVGDVVPGPSRHQDRPVVADLAVEGQVVFRWAHLHSCPASFDPKELVSVLVDLDAYVSSWFDAHEGQLEVGTGPAGGAVVLVGQRVGLMALTEIPQVCASKFLTCEAWSR